MNIFKFAIGILITANAVPPAFACSLPEPMPQPPSLSRIDGEGEQAFLKRSMQAVLDYKTALDAYKSADEKSRQALQDFRIARDERNWDNAAYVGVARIENLTPAGDYEADIRFEMLNLVKGEGTIGTLERRAQIGPITSCGGTDPALGDTKGEDPNEYFVIFLDTENPGPLTSEQVIPLGWIWSPRVRGQIGNPPVIPAQVGAQKARREKPYS